MSQLVAFASRGDLIASLNARIKGLDSQIDAIDSEIRSVQFEQAVRSDHRQTKQAGYPHPKSKKGRDGIKACRDRIKSLTRQRSTVIRDRAKLRTDARYHENIAAAAVRPLRTKEPMRKL